MWVLFLFQLGMDENLLLLQMITLWVALEAIWG